MSATVLVCGSMFESSREIKKLTGHAGRTWVIRLILLCYKKTTSCKIILWANTPRQAGRRSALRHM